MNRGLVGLPWGIYARLSDDKGAEQTATTRQIADRRRLAGDRGWVVAEAHVYEDVDLSAFKQVRRPEFERLLEDLDAGLLAGVICWKLDRLTRSHRDFERCGRSSSGVAPSSSASTSSSTPACRRGSSPSA
jgi:hypothetical protein